MAAGKGEIIIYQEQDGSPHIEVTLDGETLWLSQRLIADLFEKDSDTIGTHIKNIYVEAELEEEATTTTFIILQKEGKRKINRNVKFYNLDVILSVGYRVSSKRGTAFRIWANTILKDYLVKGYAHNEKLLREKTAQHEALRRAVGLLSHVAESQQLTGDEATGLLKVLTDYSFALDVLDKYDHRTLTVEGTHQEAGFVASYEDAIQAIQGLRDKFGGSSLFGNEKDESFKSSMAAIYQSFGGTDLYPSIEEKAAHLLYFVVKNHSFSDGNKRIAAFLFVWFLEKNQLLYRKDGSKRLADNALVALTLMIAESKPDERDIMVQVVVNLINSRN
jgi:prophage maintenance system killer protein